MTPFEQFLSQLRKTVTEIACPQAAKALANGEALLIDVRELPERVPGHIPDSIHIPRSHLEMQIGTLIPDLNTPMILHCGGGIRSLLAADSLQRIGYKNVKSLAGGYKAWCTAGLSFA